VCKWVFDNCNIFIIPHHIVNWNTYYSCLTPQSSNRWLDVSATHLPSDISLKWKSQIPHKGKRFFHFSFHHRVRISKGNTANLPLFVSPYPQNNNKFDSRIDHHRHHCRQRQHPLRGLERGKQQQLLPVSTGPVLEEGKVVSESVGRRSTFDWSHRDKQTVYLA